MSALLTNLYESYLIYFLPVLHSQQPRLEDPRGGPRDPRAISIRPATNELREHSSISLLDSTSAGDRYSQHARQIKE